MVQGLVRAIGWMMLYLALATLPLVVAVLGAAPEGRGWLVEFGVALGMIGFAMLGLQFVTTSRLKWVAPFFGTDAQIQFHRETGILAVLFVLAHPLALIAADREYLAYLDPSVNLVRALALSAAVGALLLLVILPLWRAGLGMSYEWWRVTHGALAAFVVIIGLVHVLQVGHYVHGLWKPAIWIVSALLILAALVHVRLIKPLRMKTRPWRVTSVKKVGRDTYNLALEADGHDGMKFVAGQYVWLTLGDTPFSLQQHPFSPISSDVMADRMDLGIRESGDFTATIKHVATGTPAFLEGPYGAFILDPGAEGAVFVCGGIGITPALCMLRSCRDHSDSRRFLLIYANDQLADVAYRDELNELREDLDLTIVHVLQDPPESWDGEKGYVDETLLTRHLDREPARDMQYFICGPSPMMDQVEKALHARKVPQWRILSERFDFV